MPDAAPGWNIQRYKELDSTNSAALRLPAMEDANKTVILAERQTDGRGRMRRIWESSGPQGLWATLILVPSLPWEKLTPAPLVLGIAVREAVASYSGVRLQTKWPNDLLAGGRKCCGLLVETGPLPLVADSPIPLALGVGINVNHREEDFSPDLVGKAVSLRILSGRRYSKTGLLKAVLERVDYWFALWDRAGFAPAREAWLEDNDTLGREITLPEEYGRQRAEAVDLDWDGALLARTGSGEILRIDTGEIEQVRKIQIETLPEIG